MLELTPDQVVSCFDVRRQLEGAFPGLMRRAIESAGSTRADVERSLGLRPGKLNRSIGDDPSRHVPAAWLTLLPRAVLFRLLSDMLLPLGLMVAELPCAEPDQDDDLAVAMELHRAANGAVNMAIEAIMSGSVTAATGAAMLEEIDEAIAAALTLRALAARAIRERVVGTRRAQLRSVGT